MPFNNSYLSYIVLSLTTAVSNLFNSIFDDFPGLKNFIFHFPISCMKIDRLVITKGYGAQATTIEGQNAVAPTLCFAQVSRDRW